MNTISQCSAEVTVKNDKILNLDDLLLELEDFLPFPNKFKRTSKNSNLKDNDNDVR